MKIVLRADAGRDRGTGHVMRCLTLAEPLLDRGHEVVILGDIAGVEWLDEYVDAMGIPRIPTAQDALSADELAAFGADRLVVDSYWINPADIAAANGVVPTLAIIDNETRGIDATWYLDHNLGAEELDWSAASGEVLAGSRFALVRRAISQHRIERGWQIPRDDAHVVAFMGGTDPGDVMTSVVQSIAAAMPHVRLTAVTTASQVPGVEAAASAMPHATVLGPRPDLPAILATADLVVSAAGTSAWDVCSMGRPVVLVGVVDNQSAGLARALERGIALGIDATKYGAGAVGGLLAQLVDDDVLREAVVRRANEVFDGQGPRRVADALTGGSSGA
jgi:spore coat polysaccharide biosynthesis predicted glycosyltransferase SpsG